jgi:prophage regulatory protein
MKTKNYPKILRKPDVLAKTGLSKSTLYNRIKSGQFPPPVSLGERAVGFVSTEVDAVIHAMIQEQTPEQIKALVADLIKQRQQAA